MALNKRTRKERPIVENIGPTSIEETALAMSSENLSLKKKAGNSNKHPQKEKLSIDEELINFKREHEFSASDRKTIKIDPDIKSIIEIISEFNGAKEYSAIREIIEYYFNNNYNERTQRIISIMQNNKFIK